MSLKEISIETAAETHPLSAYVCDADGCWRCYSEASGYFDFVAGRAILAKTQVLCKTDARAMYLEQTHPTGEATWRCPECATVKRS